MSSHSFAGHGGVVDGTYYLLPRDADPKRYVFTGFCLSELFRMVSTANLNHVNIVIDACNTGGLVNDLGSLLKPEVIGKRGTFGVSILAAAASDEFALEENGQGLMTTSVLNLLSGKKEDIIGQ